MNFVTTFWSRLKNWRGVIGITIGIITLDLLIINFGSVFADSNPFIAVAISWIWFLLPGMLISFVLADHISWWERIPVSFVLTVGLATPITIISILLQLDLNKFTFLHTCILLISLVAWLIYRLRIQQTKEHLPSSIPKISLDLIRKRFTPLILVFIIFVGIFTYLSFKWPLYGDDVAGLSIYAEVIRLNRITGTEPFHGTGTPATPRNELITWTYMSILTNKISGAPPTEFVINSRPILIALAMLSLATLLNQSLKNRYHAQLLLCLWSIYLLATTQSEGVGSDFITRIIQDKYFGWFVAIPIILVFMLWFVESRSWSKLIGFGILTFGASLVHPITLTQAMILIGGFGLVHLVVVRSRRAFINLLIVAGILLASTTIPFIQYIRFNAYLPIETAGLGDAVEFGKLSSAVNRYRLWLLNGDQFILHPRVILEPIIIAAFILLPLIWIKGRKHLAAQLIIGTLLILPVLLYIPYFAFLTGKVVTPYLIWRLAWPLPLFAVLAVGWVLWMLLEIIGNRLKVNGNRQSINNIIYPGLIVLILILATPNIKLGLKDYYTRRSEINLSTCETAKNALSYLDVISKTRYVNVLATHNLNFCIPGYAALANVVEFRGYGTVNRLPEEDLAASVQRVEDVNYFNVTKLFDSQMIMVLLRNNIDYILIEKEKLDLDLQFRLQPTIFKNIYEDTIYTLYEIQKPLHPSKIAEANTNLSLNQFDIALKNYSQILQQDPASVLAHLGIGLAQEGIGNNDLAMISYQKAIQYAPNEAALHTHLASSYMVKEDFENAIKEYKIAINLSPERYSLYARLGQMYILAGQAQEAKTVFEIAASLQATKDSAAYYSILGDEFRSANLLTEAIQDQEKAISIEASVERYVLLARALTASGKYEEAIKVYKTASDLDQWNYLPHLDLGYLYKFQGRIDEAIQEFEIACRLNPTNVSSYISLGLAINMKSGLDTASKRLEEYKKLNRVLPGPYRGLTTVLIANNKFDEALQELNSIANIQPESPAVQTAKGIIAMANGQTEAAYDAFSKALSFNPDLISARLGLSALYRSTPNSSMEIAQLIQIVRQVPMTRWSHLILAQAYVRMGDSKSAQEEIEWAIKLDPTKVEGYIARGNLNKERLNYGLAIQDFEKALEIDPQNLKALMGLGGAYQNLANITEAERTYNLASKYHEDSVQPKIKLVDIYWQQGRFKEATALAESTAKTIPDSDLGLIKLAEIYRMQGRIEEAKTLYERVIQTKPHVIGAYSALAQLMEDEINDQSMLLSWFDDLLNSNSESAEAYLVVGQYLIDQGQLDRAEQIFKTALTFSDVKIENYLSLSGLQQKRGEWEDALSTLKIASGAFPGKAIAFVHLANFYLNTGDISNTEINFNKAIELEPDFISAYVGKSKIAQIKGNTSGAESVIQKLITINPGSPQVYLAMSDFQESIGRIDLAEKNIQNALAIMPSDIKIQRTLGQFYLRQNRNDEAFIVFQKALQLPGSKLEIYLDIGNVQLMQRQTVEAIASYKAAGLMDRSDVRPYLALANLYQSTEKWDQALTTLNAALKISPANIEANLALGELYQRLASFDNARLYFERAYSYNHSQIDSLIALAEISRNNGDLDQAITYLEQAIASSPTSLPAYVSLAQTYQINGNYSQAETIISRGVQNAINKQDAYLSRAAFYENRSLWNLAQADYEKAWSLAPYSKSLGLKVVNYHLSRNNHEQALKILSQLENRVGSDTNIKIEYGKIYSAKAKWAEAIEAFKQAIDLDDHAKDAYIGLAQIYELQGNMQEAINLYQIAKNNISNDPDILVKLGEALRLQGNYWEAYKVFQNLLELEPMNYTGLMNLEQLNKIMQQPELNLLTYEKDTLLAPSSKGFIMIALMYQYRGKWNAVHSWLQKAISLEPYDSENWFHMGNYYRKLGQWEKALESYQQGLKYEPNSFDLLLAIGSVQEELDLLDTAQDSYRRAIEVKPGRIEGYIALSKLHFSLKETEQSLSMINEGITQVPGDYRGYQALGKLYISIDPKNELQAEEAYKKGLDVLPGSSELYDCIGDLYTNRVLADQEKQENTQTNLDIEAAMTNYKNALNLGTNNERSLIGIGELMLAQDLKDEAVMYFENAVSANPHSISSLSYLGDIYLELGRIDDAIGIFNQILVFDPENIIAHVRLSDAYLELKTLNITQSVASVEDRLFNLSSLVEHFRNIEIRKSMKSQK